MLSTDYFAAGDGVTISWPRAPPHARLPPNRVADEMKRARCHRQPFHGTAAATRAIRELTDFGHHGRDIAQSGALGLAGGSCRRGRSRRLVTDYLGYHARSSSHKTSPIADGSLAADFYLDRSSQSSPSTAK